MCDFADLLEAAETYGCGKAWDHSALDKRVVRLLMALDANYLLVRSGLSPSLENLTATLNANFLISVEKHKDQKLVEVFFAHKHRVERYPIPARTLCTRADGDLIYKIFCEILNSDKDLSFLEDPANLITRRSEANYSVKSRNKKKNTINNL